MTDLQNKPALAKAVVALIKAVGPIAKSMEIGTGKNSYKGVADKDVKDKVGQALAENGLCLLPIDVEANESTYTSKGYNGEDKVNFFVSVKTKYLLLHESGESVVLSGYGHGTDTQDKAAGKATTYALKYLLLYLSMAPTGNIDDTDGKHSDDLPPRTVVAPEQKPKATAQQAVSNFEKEKTTPAPKATPTPAPPKADEPIVKHRLVVGDEKWERVKAWVISNKGKELPWLLDKISVNNEFGEDVVGAVREIIS